MGYDSQHRDYILYSPSYKVVLVSRDVKFNELPDNSTSKEDVDLEDSSVAPSWLDLDVYKSPYEQNSPT